MSGNQILVVEDEPHIAEVLTHALNEESLDTTRVGTISDAREAYKNNTFDLTSDFSQCDEKDRLLTLADEELSTPTFYYMLTTQTLIPHHPLPIYAK